MPFLLLLPFGSAMHLHYNNVNDAFVNLVGGFYHTYARPELIVKTSSRVGEVLQLIEPVTITYHFPLQRVLFNEARDANPFFHLMESLWMLGGRRDIDPMAYYAANYRECVQDGDNPNANGAYGYRWRKPLNTPASTVLHLQDCDQLKVIVEQLKSKPESRRVNLQMWTVLDDLMKIDTSKDVCCNTNAFFLINRGKLDMTVCNRSNDLIWGALGANVVHFSFLQEYLAAHIGVEAGVYNQFTNNLHVYTSRFEPEKWLADTTPDYYNRLPRLNGVKLVADPKTFDRELKVFNDEWLAVDLSPSWEATFKEPFFQTVAKQAAMAFRFHKKRDYANAIGWANDIAADDWRTACVGWLRRRKASYERAKEDGVNYEDNRNPYLDNELNRRKESANAGTVSEEK